jgi:hypothetical protein
MQRERLMADIASGEIEVRRRIKPQRCLLQKAGRRPGPQR